jgi:carbon monoxide dehydrogenase subunit G
MEFSGTLPAKASADYIFQRLTDVRWISACIPNLERLDVMEGDEFKAVFKLDLAESAKGLHLDYLTRITTEMRFKFLKMERDETVLEGSGRVVGSKMVIRLSFKIREDSAAASILWHADVEFGLLLKAFGEELIRKISADTIGSITDCLSRKLGETQ